MLKNSSKTHRTSINYIRSIRDIMIHHYLPRWGMYEIWNFPFDGAFKSKPVYRYMTQGGFRTFMLWRNIHVVTWHNGLRMTLKLVSVCLTHRALSTDIWHKGVSGHSCYHVTSTWSRGTLNSGWPCKSYHCVRLIEPYPWIYDTWGFRVFMLLRDIHVVTWHIGIQTHSCATYYPSNDL